TRSRLEKTSQLADALRQMHDDEIDIGVRSEERRVGKECRLGRVTVADDLEAQHVTTNLLKFMRASIKMIGVSNLQSFIASMTLNLTITRRHTKWPRDWSSDVFSSDLNAQPAQENVAVGGRTAADARR